MNLDFDRLVVQNFKSLADIDLDLKSRGPGLHFLRGQNLVEPELGSNDAGKTSLWGALAWCLFGRTVDGLKGVDVHPWDDPKAHTMVAIHIRVDGKKHFIGRALNPNWTQLDGTDCGQEHIDNLLQLSFDVFRHTILLGQSQPLFFDLSPRDKMELFTAVLDLDRWEERSERADQVTDDFLAQKQKLTTELATLQASLDEVQHLVKDTKAKSDEWEGSHMKRVKDDKATLKECLAKLDRKKIEQGKWDLEYEGAALELKACEGLISTLHREKRESLVDADRAHRLREELQSLSTAKTCPTCGQPIVKKNLVGHKAELEAEIQKLTPAVERVTDLDAKIDAQIEYEHKFAKKVSKATREIELLYPDIYRLISEINGLQVRISGTDIEKNPHRDLIEDLKARERDLKLDCADVISEITDVTTKIDRTKPWIKGFKEVRLYIIEELLQELELVINFMLKELGLVDWKVQFEIEKETKSGKTNPGLNTVILSPRNKTPVKWEVWGGGVGQRLRVLSALALSEVLLNRAGVNPNLEILDEPSRHMNDLGVDDLCECLADRAQQLGKSIWLVDHIARESSQFTSVLTVCKTKTGSFLED